MDKKLILFFIVLGVIGALLISHYIGELKTDNNAEITIDGGFKEKVKSINLELYSAQNEVKLTEISKKIDEVDKEAKEKNYSNYFSLIAGQKKIVELFKTYFKFEKIGGEIGSNGINCSDNYTEFIASDALVFPCSESKTLTSLINKVSENEARKYLMWLQIKMGMLIDMPHRNADIIAKELKLITVENINLTNYIFPEIYLAK